MPIARLEAHERISDLPVRTNLPQPALLIPTLNQIDIRSRLVPREGRVAIVTDAEWHVVDAGCASDEGIGLRTAKVVWS